jgi:hypothetical protein
MTIICYLWCYGNVVPLQRENKNQVERFYPFDKYY